MMATEYRNASIYKQPPTASTASVTVPRPGRATEKVLERVGVALMLMLQDEYGPAAQLEPPAAREAEMLKRNVALAHIHPADAVDSLRKELRECHKGRSPFNRRVRDSENAREWWATVGKDEDATILGVSRKRFYK
jgi:hypothetical protein